jgi:hypothetical protein
LSGDNRGMRIGVQRLRRARGRFTARGKAGFGHLGAAAERGSSAPLLRQRLDVTATMREVRKRAQNHDWFIDSGSWAALCDAVADRRFLLEYIGQLERSCGVSVSEPAERSIPETRIYERIQSLLDCAREAAAGGLTLVAETHEHQIRALESLLEEDLEAGSADAVACADPVFGPAVFGPVGRSV